MPSRVRVQQDAENQRLQVVRRKRTPARFQAQPLRTGTAVVRKIQPLPGYLHAVYRAVGNGLDAVHEPAQEPLRGGALFRRLRRTGDGERHHDTA